MTKEEFIKSWDSKIKPHALKHFEIENQIDNLAEYYIKSMISAVEHDIADGRILGLNGFNLILQVRGTLSDDEYYTNVHKNIINPETISLKQLANLITESLNYLK